ncbi:MAG: hypothetical protein M3364_09295 [Actinomycetota bacterium]|nr:hypothetical protein [Actinomycetota bacterium]
MAASRSLIGSYMGSAAPQRDIQRLVDLWRVGWLPVERLRSATLELVDVDAALDALSGGQVVSCASSSGQALNSLAVLTFSRYSRL